MLLVFDCRKLIFFENSWKWNMRKVILSAIFCLIAFIPAQAANNPVRALHFVIFDLTVADAKRIIDDAAKANFNTVIIGLDSNLKLESTPWIEVTSKTWQPADLVEVVNYARSKHMEVIPQLQLLSHQDVLLAKSHPQLLYNQETYDPRKKEVYEIIFPVIDEIVALIHPSAIHIGHDEVLGWSWQHWTRGLLKVGEHILPPELFLEDVNVLHEYLRKKHIETWLWGDMLISPDEFPTIKDAGDLNGSEAGYGKVLRKKLPKDIVICDWRYRNAKSSKKEFPTLAAFKVDGFRVLGATWRDMDAIKKFSQYAANNGAEGMIATTWFINGVPDEILVNNWDKLERLIRESGEIFNTDFPSTQ